MFLCSGPRCSTRITEGFYGRTKITILNAWLSSMAQIIGKGFVFFEEITKEMILLDSILDSHQWELSFDNEWVPRKH